MPTRIAPPDPENAIVVGRIDLAPGLMILRVAPVQGELPQFRPGQFLPLGLPDSHPVTTLADQDLGPGQGAFLRRPYSISSGSRQRSYIEFYIALVHSGQLTPRLFTLQTGDRLWMGSHPGGVFTLENVPPDSGLLLLATGTGLGPYMSMLRSHLGRRAYRRIGVVQGARHSWDLGYRSELTTLAEVMPRLNYVPVLSRPAQEHVRWEGLTGHLQDRWDDHSLQQAFGWEPDPGQDQVLLCGNPQMVEAMRQRFIAAGFCDTGATSNVHTERYW